MAVVERTAVETGPRAHRPMIPATAALRELTPVPLIVGVLLGVVFGASSLYLVLKVGLTVSASIPVAVISLTLFRILGRLGLGGATVLENNIVQTAGSAGESIAFGLGVTMPAIMILGFDLEITRVIVVAVLGGLLGILMMIPLRRALIVQQHGVLKYPEGTACAEVLKAGATPEERAMGIELPEDAADRSAAASGASTIFTGFGIGVVYKLAMDALRLWKDTPEKIFGAPLAASSVSAEISPELLGVGYIIGPKIACTMAAGGVLAYMVLIPAIKFFGSAGGLIIPPGTTPIAQMGPDEIRGAYVLYIGAGAVATGGIISLVRSLPMIWRGIVGGMSDLRSRREAAAAASVARTDRDLPNSFVVGGVVVLLVAIMLVNTLHMNLVGALLIVVFGFLFVTVSSRLTGQIGSSSNPISGMTVATLLLTCLIFLALGWTGPSYYVTALSVGGIVCIAASNGGTTSQDLKTGFLLGATPRSQQIAIIAGAAAAALLLGPILLKLNDAATVYVPVGPKAVAAAPGQSETVPAAWTVPATALAGLKPEKITGPQAVSDGRVYHVFNKTDDVGGAPGRYLVNDQGTPVWLVDPGINGTHKVRPDGTKVTKYSAPKATLMSYIIKGILNQQLPWTLVILGAMIALVLELMGIGSLAFAVGVYLPISSSMPVLVGGLVRWAVDRHIAGRTAHLNLSEEELIAETDKSPGVLMASGYIAGGAIAGIGIAFISGGMEKLDQRINDVMTASNPFFNGPWSDALALIPFAAIMLALYLAGRMKTEG
ncbi:OPT family oligopeptide transporter [Caulobacter sp. KR2-114]|uniref:OPT family oligopeptide transporter n=1 Tax=Caulobacter sp. KR2-114 TaxID=3400912 RepID=UPI003C0A4E9D